MAFVEALAPFVAALTTFIILNVLMRRHDVPLDRPNERSLHSSPVPRAGGLAILPAVIIGWTCVAYAVPWIVWAFTVFLFVVSLLDDAVNLPVAVRLLAHLIAASTAAGMLVLPASGWMAALAAALAITWMTNLYNFMDGSDGLAGGMALIGFSIYAVAAWISSATTFALACLVISAATAVFLRYNFHPARIFLGDAGSIPLGFLAAVFGVQGWLNELWPVWFPLLVFSPFIVDASVTLLRRALNREKIWQAHRNHYYQRLVRLGWGHLRTALLAYLLMISCGLAALAALNRAAIVQGILLAGSALIYIVLLRILDRAWHRHEQASR